MIHIPDELHIYIYHISIYRWAATLGADEYVHVQPHIPVHPHTLDTRHRHIPWIHDIDIYLGYMTSAYTLDTMYIDIYLGADEL